jgi:hypothetical protein
MKKVLLAVLAVACIVFLFSNVVRNQAMLEAPGVVALNGFTEGVAICGHEEPQHWWTRGGLEWAQRDGYVLMVNRGHMQDAQVHGLELLAKSECGRHQ